MKPLDDKEYRAEFVSAMVSNSVALQIRELRKKSTLSQKKLAKKMGKKQSVISRLEDPEYGAFNVRTLLEMANAFDVALLVKFIPFSELMNRSRHLAPNDLGVPSYTEETRRMASAGTTESAVQSVCQTNLTAVNFLENSWVAAHEVGHG